jgi:hypothetical protein
MTPAPFRRESRTSLRTSDFRSSATEVKEFSITILTIGKSTQKLITWMISGFRRDVGEICALLGCYAALSRSPVQTFGYNLSVPSSRAKKAWIS